MKEAQAIIERVRRVNDAYQHLIVAVEPWLTQLKPGQSVLAATREDYQPYLREQWWLMETTKSQITVERPSHLIYEPGQVVRLLGAVGQPLRFRRGTLRNVLLIAYETPPTPLLMAIAPLLNNRVSVTLVLLGAAADYQTEHLPPELEILKGDEQMNWPNRVTTVGWADQVFVVVPQSDELRHFRFIYETFAGLRSEIPPGYLFGLFQPLLPCGIGACDACVLRLRGAYARICEQGPAFDLRQVLLG
jgi:hypothetical protein